MRTKVFEEVKITLAGSASESTGTCKNFRSDTFLDSFQSFVSSVPFDKLVDMAFNLVDVKCKHRRIPSNVSKTLFLSTDGLTEDINLRRMVVDGLLALDKMPFINWSKALVHPGYTCREPPEQQDYFQLKAEEKESFSKALRTKALTVMTTLEIANEIIAATAEDSKQEPSAAECTQAEEFKVLANEDAEDTD